MTTFLMLTIHSSNEKARVSADQICAYYKENNTNTTILMNNSRVVVKETPEQIDRLLIEAFYTVKEIKNAESQV